MTPRIAPSLVAIASLWLLAAPALLGQLADFTPEDLEADAIINESYGILREREPQMTEAEYAIYEKVVPMVFEQPDFALTLLEAMQTDDDPSSPAFKLVLANVYYSQDRFEDAKRLYREAVDEYPQFRRAWENLGVLHFRNSDYRQAIPCLVRAYELGARQPRILGILGYCQLQSGNPIAAETAFLNAHLADPDNHRWIEALLELYLKSEQYARAEALAARRLELMPKDPEAWLLHANCLQRLGRTPDAIAALELAATLEVANARSLRYLADLYVAKNADRDAARVYGQALRTDPEQSSASALAYALSLIDSGQLDLARRLLEALPSQLEPPERRQRLYAQARIAFQTDDFNRAESRLNELLAIAPLDGPALLLMASTLENREQPAKAELFYEQAIADPNSAYLARVNLSRLALDQGDFSSAIQHAEAALALRDSPSLRQHLARIKSYAALHDES